MKSALTFACIAAFAAASTESDILDLQDRVEDLEEKQYRGGEMFLNNPGYSVERKRCYTTHDVPTGHVFEINANFSTGVINDAGSQALLLTLNKIENHYKRG